MEIQLRLEENSERLVFQSKLIYDENWIARIEIVQEEGLIIYVQVIKKFLLRKLESISKKKRIVAKGLFQDSIYDEEERCNHLWEPTYCYGIFQYNFNNYEMATSGSGTKGDISLVTKDGYPIFVYASNFSVAGKRNFSLYTGNTEKIDILLFFYAIQFISGFDFLDINSLSARFHLFYQFNTRSVITKKYLEMLLESRRPFRL